jgi:hypothetical protein
MSDEIRQEGLMDQGPHPEGVSPTSTPAGISPIAVSTRICKLALLEVKKYERAMKPLTGINE